MTQYDGTSSVHARETAPDQKASWLDPLRGAWRAWNRWWFEPASTVPIALFRICYGALILVFVALLVPDLQVWFGRGGPFTPEDAVRFWGSQPDYSVLLWFPAPSAVVAFFVAFTLAAFCLMIGLWTRLSALIVFIGLVSIGHRNPLILHGGDTLLRLMAFYLILAPAGAAMSVDRLRALARGTAGPRPPLAPPWAMRLLQLQVAFVYAMTVLLKLKGAAWADGTALYYTSRLEEFHRFPVPFLSDSMIMVNLLTYWTLAAELALAFLIWVPVLRWFVLLNGVALHLGIEYSMNVPLFAFTMIIAYITFVDVEAAWQRILSLLPLRRLQHGTLWVGDGCRVCVPAARVLLALDILRRLDVGQFAPPPQTGRLPDRPTDHLQIETAAGCRLSGLAAWRWLARRLPLLWLGAPILYLPGVDRLYDWVVRRAHAPRPLDGETPRRSRAVTSGPVAPVTVASAGVQGAQGVPTAHTQPMLTASIDDADDMDAISAFLRDRCFFRGAAITPADILFDTYTRWARAHDDVPLSQRAFGMALTERGLSRRRHGKANRWHWVGVGLVAVPNETAHRPTDANRSQTGPAEAGGAVRPTAGSSPSMGAPGFAAMGLAEGGTAYPAAATVRNGHGTPPHA